MPQQVLFIRRHGPHWPGANPTLPDDRAKQLIAEQVCIPYTDAARDKVRGLLANPVGPPTESVNLSQARPRSAKPADEEEVEVHPLDQLGLDTRAANALTAAGLADVTAVQKYADTHESFAEIEGIGAAGSDQIRAALKKAAKK